MLSREKQIWDFFFRFVSEKRHKITDLKSPTFSKLMPDNALTTVIQCHIYLLVISNDKDCKLRAAAK